MVEVIRCVSEKKIFHDVIVSEFKILWKRENTVNASPKYVTSGYNYELVWQIFLSTIPRKNGPFQGLNELQLQRCDRKDIYVNVDVQFNSLGLPHLYLNAAFNTNSSLPIKKHLSYVSRDEKTLYEIRVQIYRQEKIFCEMAKDYEYLLKNEILSDVILVVADRKFSAHRQILAARSTVFAKMFECDMLEKKNRKTEIKEIDPKIFELLLRFIYTGQVTVEDNDTWMKLIVAADMYQIDSLKYICGQSIAKILNLNNAINVLILADLMKADALKTAAAEFIIANKNQLVGTAEYENMIESHSQLVADLFRRLMLK